MPSTTMLSRLLATKALVVIALAAGTTGGVALAATSSTSQSSQQSTSTSSVPDASNDVSATASAEPTPTVAPTTKANGVGPVNAKGTPHPSVRGLCQARAAGATSNGGKAALNPAFQATAGEDCAALVLPTSHGKAHATLTATPTAEPTVTADPTPTTAPVTTTSAAKNNSDSHRQSGLHSNSGAQTGGSNISD
jgi:hypothetical protein